MRNEATMGKYDDTLAKIRDFFDGLTGEAKSKCALCNETLTHIVKMAEVETGAGTATVTKVLAEKINEGAVEGDKVSGNALRVRVQYAEGKKSAQSEHISQSPVMPTVKPGQNGQKINPKTIVEEVDRRVKNGKSIRAAAQEIAEESGKKASTVREAYRKEKEKAHYQCTATQAVSFAQMAIFQLERITKDDEQWDEALLMVENWISKFRSTK
jgi:hypothetical protein